MCRRRLVRLAVALVAVLSLWTEPGGAEAEQAGQAGGTGGEARLTEGELVSLPLLTVDSEPVRQTPTQPRASRAKRRGGGTDVLKG